MGRLSNKELDLKKAEVALTVVSVMVDAIRDRGKGSGVYVLDLKHDPDRVFERAQEMLAERAALPEADRKHLPNFVLLTPKLYSGRSVIVDKDGEVNKEIEHKIRGELTLIAAQRGGSLHGKSVAQIGSMRSEDLESFRKEVCSQKNGGVQFENTGLYWLGGGREKWMYKELRKLFPELKAITKIAGKDRQYEIRFEGGAVTGAFKAARSALATSAKAAAEEAERKAKEKLAKQKAKKADAKGEKTAAKKSKKKAAAKKAEEAATA